MPLSVYKQEIDRLDSLALRPVLAVGYLLFLYIVYRSKCRNQNFGNVPAGRDRNAGIAIVLCSAPSYGFSATFRALLQLTVPMSNSMASR
eukprot:scaffold35556_cov16-Prasinocladus_malaysianus.AAC.1